MTDSPQTFEEALTRLAETSAWTPVRRYAEIFNAVRAAHQREVEEAREEGKRAVLVKTQTDESAAYDAGLADGSKEVEEKVEAARSEMVAFLNREVAAARLAGIEEGRKDPFGCGRTHIGDVEQIKAEARLAGQLEQAEWDIEQVHASREDGYAAIVNRLADLRKEAGR